MTHAKLHAIQMPNAFDEKLVLLRQEDSCRKVVGNFIVAALEKVVDERLLVVVRRRRRSDLVEEVSKLVIRLRRI